MDYQHAESVHLRTRINEAIDDAGDTIETSNSILLFAFDSDDILLFAKKQINQC